jgi:hypothetical protein
MEHLVADAVDDREGDRGAVLARVDVDPERSFAEGRIDDADDRASDLARICVVRDDLPGSASSGTIFPKARWI